MIAAFHRFFAMRLRPHYLSLPKTPFALSLLNLSERGYSLQTICSRLFFSLLSRLGNYFEAEPLWFAKVMTGERQGPSVTVDNFVTAKAPSFNRLQQAGCKRFNRNPQISISAGIWFGTRRSVVQIHSPRPLFPIMRLNQLMLVERRG